MHILFLTDNFTPESNAPANRTHEHAKVWVQQGHQVTIITCAPNFPSGRVFPGYKNKLYQTETIDGIVVIRVWTFMASNSGFLLRLFDFLSFMLTSFFGGLFLTKTDIIIGTSPQFFTVCSAYLLSKFKRVPFVFEMRDIWPDSLDAVGVRHAKLFTRLMNPVADFLYRNADHIVVVTSSFKEYLLKKKISGDKITVVTNGIDVEKFQPVAADKNLIDDLNLTSKFIIGYIGTHGMAHHLQTLVDAAKVANGAEHLKRIHFLTIGTGAEFARLKKSSQGLENFQMIGQIPRSQIHRYWSIIDLAIIHLRDNPLFETVIPSKMFEAIAMGVPILHGVRGESAQIVKKYHIGVTFSSQQPLELLQQAQRVMEDDNFRHQLKRNAIKTSKLYCRKKLAMEMLTCLKGVLIRHA